MARRRPTAAQRAKQSAQSLMAFVSAAPSSYHATAHAVERLVDAGFARLDEREEWSVEPGGYVVERDGAFIAFRIPEGTTPTTRFAIVGAHTDSPSFRVKPVADRVSNGWRLLNVEVYGGPLLNSWLDRDLEIAGRLSLRSGETRLVRTGPVARIPQLAVHLDRAVNTEGVKLDRQRHTSPVLGLEQSPAAIDTIAKAAGVDAADVAGWDLLLAPTEAPAFLGADESLLASSRLDNLISVHAGLHALIETVPVDVIPVLAAFDHEETGSATRSGAAGPFLEDVLDRIQTGLGASGEERHRARAASWHVSSDVGHSVHPNYPERHDDAVRPVLGGGTIIKTNADQRYSTDARGAALWLGVCQAAGVGAQHFVSNNQIPSGSTIGPISATRLGISTVDVGVPILSMHSARELCSPADVDALGRALGVFLAGAWPERL